MRGKARGPGKACARPPGRRAYAGGQARICTGLQRGTPLQDRRHRCTEGIHTRGSRRARSTDKGAWDRPGATAQARKEHAHAGQAAAKVHTTRREDRSAAGQRAFPLPLAPLFQAVVSSGGKTRRPPAPLSRRCAAKPYRMRGQAGRMLPGRPRPVSPDFYHFYPILEYCLF